MAVLHLQAPVHRHPRLLPVIQPRQPREGGGIGRSDVLLPPGSQQLPVPPSDEITIGKSGS